jgi:hypothetical protein
VKNIDRPEGPPGAVLDDNLGRLVRHFNVAFALLWHQVMVVYQEFALS